MRTLRLCVLLAALLAATGALSAADGPLFKASENIPADATVLFDGKDTSGWVHDDGRPAGWKVENGYMEVRGGSIHTKQEFGDCQLHVEFWLPLMADAKGQGRANSGVYLQGSFEIQVLDSYGLKSGMGDCGALYGIAVPLVNACRPSQQWQTYDAFYKAPRFDDQGNKTASARMTVLHNGVLIHDSVELPSPTTAAMHRELAKPGPLMLQDHGCPVRYRNVWIRPL